MSERRNAWSGARPGLGCRSCWSAVLAQEAIDRPIADREARGGVLAADRQRALAARLEHTDLIRPVLRRQLARNRQREGDVADAGHGPQQALRIGVRRRREHLLDAADRDKLAG